MNDLTFEKCQLLDHINNQDVFNLLKKANCFIAGGAITSLFSGKDINDIDVYFRDFNSLNFVLQNLFKVEDSDELDMLNVSSFSLIYTNYTKKSILFTKDGLNVQLIYFKFFNTPQEIFDTFDFTINMGVFDCSTETFTFHENFLKDIAQRRLVVNPNTSFPIISLLRIDKYKQRGYRISRKDFINLCLSVNRLELDTWEKAADAIGGMYGYTYTELFDTTKEFSIDEVINQVTSLESVLDSTNSSSEYLDYYKLIDKIRINLKIPIPPEDKIFYKKVLKTENPNVFKSYYYKSFEYPINETVNGGSNGIWAYKSIRAASNHFISNNKNDEVIISLKAADDATIEKNGSLTRNIFGNVQVIGVVN